MASVTKTIGRLFTRIYTETEIMEGLRDMNPDIMQYMYRENKPAVRKMRHDYKISGYLETHDILMDALETTIDNIRTGKYSPSGSLKSYYLRICRNNCLEYLRKNHKVSSGESFEYTLNQIRDTGGKMEKIIFGDTGDAEYLVSVVLNIVKKMDEICIRLFDLRFGILNAETGDPVMTEARGYREISGLMNMTESYARKKYERCFAKLFSEYQMNLQTIQ